MFTIINLLLMAMIVTPLAIGLKKSTLYENQELKDAEIEQGLLAALYFATIASIIVYFYIT